MKVLYVGVEDKSYPRNLRIREFLADQGVPVDVIDSPVLKGRVRRAIFLGRQFFRHTRGYSHVVLAEFSNSLFWYSWLLARLNHATHVVDFFIGKYETLVEDAGRYAASSAAARLLKLIDAATLKSADYVLTDTELRAKMFARFARTEARFFSLPVGSPFSVGGAGTNSLVSSGTPNVLYYGYYSRLHAVPEIARALVAVSQTSSFTVTMIGNGDTRSETESIVHAAGASNFTFIDSVLAQDLEARIQLADVVFGAFGTSTKARSVIPNKVWQGLYAGKVVITGESEALDEISHLVGSQLRRVPVGNSSALRDSVREAIETLNSAGRAGYSRSGEVLESHVQGRFVRVFSQIFGTPLRTAVRRDG